MVDQTPSRGRAPMPARPVAGIVFAVAQEADAFARLVTDTVETRAAGLVFHEATLADRRVAWCVGGIGAEAADRAARLLVDGHRPRLLVSAGFAGGLSASLARGAVVRPVLSVTADDAAPLPLASDVTAALDPAAAATIVSVDRVVRTPEEKRALARATGGHLVDMETRSVAVVAREVGLPCAAIRVISDDAAQPLPAEVAALARPQSTGRLLGALVGAVGRRPGAALDLWRLYEHAVVDGRTLAAALADVVARLPDDR